jgi:hypothetical protein
MSFWNTSAESPEIAAKNIINSFRTWWSIPVSISPEVLLATKLQLGYLPESERLNYQNKIDTISQQVSIEPPLVITNLFEWVESAIMKQVPKIANEVLEDNLKKWKWPPFLPEQKENIKLATIDRIASGRYLQIILDGVISKAALLWWSIWKIGENFTWRELKNIDVDTTVKSIQVLLNNLNWWTQENQTVKTLEGKIFEQVTSMMQEWIWHIQQAHESIPQPSWYMELLKNPKALSQYTYWMDIEILLQKSIVTSSSREEFTKWLKMNIQEIDSKTMPLENIKEKVFNALTNTPEIISDQLFEFIGRIFQIPVFGRFTLGFFQLDNIKTAVDDLKMEHKYRKSVNFLTSFWLSWDTSWQVSSWKNRWKIPVLNDVDFTNMDFSKIKPFMKSMRDKGIDVTKFTFWESVFIDRKIESGENSNKLTVVFPPWNTYWETPQTIIQKLAWATDNTREDIEPVRVKWSVSTHIPSKYDVSPEMKPLISPIVSPPAVLALIESSPLTLTDSIIKAFEDATTIPFTFNFEWSQRVVQFQNGLLSIGADIFSLQWQWAIAVKIKDIRIVWNQIYLDHFGWPTIESKSNIISAIPDLLVLRKWVTQEIQWNTGKLLVTKTS